MEIMLLKDSYEQLKLSLITLNAALKDTGITFIADSPGLFLSGNEAIQHAVLAIGNLWNSDESPDGRKTSVCIGAIGVDHDILELAKDVNSCKEKMKSAVHLFQNTIIVKGEQIPSKAWKARVTRNVLSDIGLGRLSLRLCNRHIPIINYQPCTIGISYSSGGKSIKKMTVQQAIQMLDSLDYESDSAKIDREALANLPPDFTVAKVTPIAGYYKANIFYEDSKKPKTMPVFLPILFLNQGAGSLNHPLALPIKDDGKRSKRKQRNDKRLADFPLISSLPIYTYDK